MKTDFGDAALITWVFISFLITSGEPDIIDAIIYWLMK